MTPLITAIDHLLITTADFAVDHRDYTELLGREAPPLTGTTARRAVFAAGNLAVHLQEDASAAPGLTGLCLRTADLARLRRRLERLGLLVGPDHEQASPEAPHGSELWLAPDPGRAYRLGFTDRPAPPQTSGVRGVSGLDHVVVASAEAAQTAFLFAAQLGLDLRMDLSRPEWNARLLFFRCGDTIIEVFQTLRPDADTSDATDRLFGLSWRVADADTRRAELAGAGFDVSGVRTGRKPGTRVFTVRDRCARVATLMLQPPA